MSSLLAATDRLHLTELVGDAVRFDEPMAKHTTLRIGGPADAWLTPASTEQLGSVLRFCAARELPVLAVGGGCNLLVRDGGLRGVVISSAGLRGLERDGDRSLRVGAGVSTAKLLAQATRWDLGGIEFLSGIPGSVGGALFMNAGTPRGEIKAVVTSVTSVRIGDGKAVTRSAAECGFAYRRSLLGDGEIITSAELELVGRPRADIEADLREIRTRRQGKEPRKVGVSGSTFKNPPGDFAGRLIEAAGLKGMRVGAAECSPVHANWMVNTGAATAADLLALIDKVRGVIAEQHAIDLELELRVVGDESL